MVGPVGLVYFRFVAASRLATLLLLLSFSLSFFLFPQPRRRCRRRLRRRRRYHRLLLVHNFIPLSFFATLLTPVLILTPKGRCNKAHSRKWPRRCVRRGVCLRLPRNTVSLPSSYFFIWLYSDDNVDDAVSDRLSKIIGSFMFAARFKLLVGTAWMGDMRAIPLESLFVRRRLWRGRVYVDRLPLGPVSISLCNPDAT